MHCVPIGFASPPPIVSLQEDGSLVISDPKGSINDFVKQGTPRQSVEIGGQNCNVSYGFNSAGNKTILVSVPALATAQVVFDLGKNRVTIPPKSALRVTLAANNQIETGAATEATHSRIGGFSEQRFRLGMIPKFTMAETMQILR